MGFETIYFSYASQLYREEKKRKREERTGLIRYLYRNKPFYTNFSTWKNIEC